MYNKLVILFSDFGMTRETAIERLAKLPSVFRVADLAEAGVGDRNSANVYINRWMRYKLIATIAPYSGIYFKVLHDDRATERCRRSALLALYPEAVLVGHSVLHGNGWTTQPCRRIQLAVLPRKSHKEMNSPGEFRQLGDFDLFAVEEEWFKLMEPWVVPPAPYRHDNPEITTYGYKALLPAAAFVECLSNMRGKNTISLDPDDYDFDELFEARETIAEIGEALGCDLPNWALVE